MTRTVAAFMFLLVVTVSAGVYACRADESWPGVDEAVVEKYAEAGGRPASEPVINIEGDALLFAFLVAGAAGGFVMGYFFRELAGSGGKAKRIDANKMEGENAG